MKITTLDKVVRGALADRGYPIHFYLQFMTYAVSCLRELNFDVLQNIKSVRLPINSYKAATLPVDFVDYIRVGNELGQYIYPWGEKRDSFNRLNKFDSQGNKIPYGDIEAANGILPNNWEGFWYTNYINDKGEHLGRIFNNIPGFRESFVILRERGEIQLDVSYSGQFIVMDYISDGMLLNASNSVHPYAIETIKAYIFWKMKEHGRQFNLSERQLAKDEFYNQLRILRSRMNTIDTLDIRRSLQASYGPVIKN
jgi:hypothetical protein